MDLKAEYTA